MPRVVKLYNKSKGSLKHNQGPIAPRPKRTAGLMSCRAKCNRDHELGSPEWEACMKSCQAELAG